MKEPQQDGARGEGGALERFSVVVIGGGPTGLATGYDLAQRGVDFVILERGERLGENWRPAWDPTRTFTPARFDGLPGFPFQGEGRLVTKDQMSEYLEQYAERFRLPVRLGINVLGLSADEHGRILVECEHSRLVADQVIVAAELQATQLRTKDGSDRRTIHLRAGDYRTVTQLSEAGEVVVLAPDSARLGPGSS